MDKAIAIKQTKALSLQQMVDSDASNRKILTKFISDHMVKGTDYGGIMIGGRMSKDSLFKPGAEKIANLLRLRADVERDNDTWEMAGSKAGLFCYKCRLYNQKNEEVGMGLGACDLTEKKNVNIAIKIAKKRSFVDAVLTTGALSDFFTQDLEDLAEHDEPIVKSAVESVKSSPCAICGEETSERKGISKAGKPYHGVFCSSGENSHTKWLKTFVQDPNENIAEVTPDEDGFVREAYDQTVSQENTPIVEANTAANPYSNQSLGALKVELASRMRSGKSPKNFPHLGQMTREEVIAELEKSNEA